MYPNFWSGQGPLSSARPSSGFGDPILTSSESLAAALSAKSALSKWKAPTRNDNSTAFIDFCAISSVWKMPSRKDILRFRWKLKQTFSTVRFKNFRIENFRDLWKNVLNFQGFRNPRFWRRCEKFRDFPLRLEPEYSIFKNFFSARSNFLLRIPISLKLWQYTDLV